MRIGALIQFLKKHYEKIILCVVLLGLAAAAITMGERISSINEETTTTISQAPHKGKLVAPLDLTSDLEALAQITNPPPVVLSGEHNLFNPVTWKRKPNGELLKILRTGPDALVITNITPLYTIIAYDHPTGTAGIYVFTVQTNSGRKVLDHPKINEKTKSGLYIVRGIKGASEDPTELQLEILQTGETVSISKGAPYKQVDGYVADMGYPPESRNLPKEHVNDMITLDNEQYKIVEITSNAVRVQSIRTTKTTTKAWKRAAETDAPSNLTPR